MVCCYGKNKLCYYIDKNGKLIVSGNDTLHCYIEFCKKVNKADREKEFTFDRGKLFYDSENDKYILYNDLLKEFYQKGDDFQEKYNFEFRKFIKEYLSQNKNIMEV